MTIHFGLNFICGIVALIVIGVMIYLGGKADKRYTGKWNAAVVCLLLVTLYFAWFGAFWTVKLIVERF